MNPTIFGVIGPGFLNQVPTLWLLSRASPKAIRSPSKGSRFMKGPHLEDQGT